MIPRPRYLDQLGIAAGRMPSTTLQRFSLYPDHFTITAQQQNGS